MKNKILRSIIFLVAFSSYGFAQTAAFSMDTSAGCSPVCISFSDQSTNPVSWSWDFGDNSTSTFQFPTHCYTTPGSYQVTLTVTFASSTGTATSNVTVYPNPVAAFTSTNNGNNTITFTDQSTGSPTSWHWSFGDTTNSISQNPVHTYAYSGNKMVCLIAMTAMGCSDTVCNVATPTAIRNFELNTNWNLFPNPSSNGNFTIQFDAPLEKTIPLTVENELGQIVFMKNISGTTEIDLSGMAAGIYFVRVGTAGTKFVKE